MNPDTILSSIASKLGVSKTALLDPTSSDAAVKQAHAETNVIKEAKAYFATHGVNLDSFKGKEYSDRAILVKNFPYGTSAEELKKMYASSDRSLSETGFIKTKGGMIYCDYDLSNNEIAVPYLPEGEKIAAIRSPIIQLTDIALVTKKHIDSAFLI